MPVSREEIDKRVQFYTKVFGEERLNKAHLFPPKLWPIKTYKDKAKGLKERGFKNPRHMIIRFPAVLCYAFQSIDEKIQGLKDRGFDDPLPLIEAMPQIFGYSFENIDRKLRLCRLLKAKVDEFISHNLLFISMSPNNYVPILRSFRARKGASAVPEPKDIFYIYIKRKYKTTHPKTP